MTNYVMYWIINLSLKALLLFMKKRLAFLEEPVFAYLGETFNLLDDSAASGRKSSGSGLLIE